jgi:mevalonate kinase
MVSARGYGHGKVILVGEHAVVYGHPAVATGISAGISARAYPGAGRLTVPAWGLEVVAGDRSDSGRALVAIIRSLGARSLDFVVDAKLPAGAGLGSSAALAVAVARAAAAATGRPDSDPSIARAVAEAEAIFHGNPSGIDAAASLSGRTGRFTRRQGWRHIRVERDLSLCIGLSGQRRDTATKIGAVARLREQGGVADEILAQLGELAENTVSALAGADTAALGGILTAAHRLLARLHLGSPEIDRLVEEARSAGAIGAKLTGAGGGGAVIALAPGREHDVLARWRRGGFAGFLAKVEAAPGEAAAASPPAPEIERRDVG